LGPSVRDEYEANKADMESRISAILGETWTIDINALEIYPYGVAKDNDYMSKNVGAGIKA
jgi:hypothetical protein